MFFAEYANENDNQIKLTLSEYFGNEINGQYSSYDSPNLNIYGMMVIILLISK